MSSKILFILASAGLMVSAIAPKATSLTLDFSRTVNNPSNDIFVSSGININNANNIYVVDGINNSLEVLDPSVWFPADSIPSSKPNIYFLNGINNTLQVLDLTSTSNITADTGNIFLLDDFNKNLAIADPNTTGLISSSGSRNGRLNIPNSAIQNPTDNYYLVDGFNNSLEITNRSGVNQVETPPAAQTFFAGSSSNQPQQLEALMSSGGTSLAENPFSRIASGSFGGVAEQQIIDSIGNPNSELGWRKNFVDETLSLQRSVSSGDWEIDSPISVSKASGVHLVDGFSNALQVIKSENSESVYLVDGTNNSLQVSDTSNQFSLFSDNNSSNFQARNGASLAGNSSDNPPDPDFFSFLGDYANGNVSSNVPEAASNRFKPEVAFDVGNSDNGLFGSTEITANPNEDLYKAQPINNRIDLVDQNGQVFSIADRQAAVDGSGNVYLAKGINNRIRVASDTQTAAEVASVPEPSSVFGLTVLGIGAARWKKRQGK